MRGQKGYVPHISFATFGKEKWIDLSYKGWSNMERINRSKQVILRKDGDKKKIGSYSISCFLSAFLLFLNLLYRKNLLSLYNRLVCGLYLSLESNLHL